MACISQMETQISLQNLVIKFDQRYFILNYLINRIINFSIIVVLWSVYIINLFAINMYMKKLIEGYNAWLDVIFENSKMNVDKKSYEHNKQERPFVLIFRKT